MDITGNNRVDDLATWFREASGQRQSREKTDHEHDAMIRIKLNGERLVSKIEECVRYHINGYHLCQYVQSKYKWTNQIWNMIDVESIGTFHKQLDAKNQIARTNFSLINGAQAFNGIMLLRLRTQVFYSVHVARRTRNRQVTC